MSPERAHAYRRVIHTVNEVGPVKLLPAERELLRHAADTLIFTRDVEQDEAARHALRDIEQLCRTLVESKRWEQTRAMRLADDVAQCGPPLLPEHKAA